MTRPDRGWPRLKRVFRLPFTRARIDSALREEFRFHIQERVDQFVAAGMPRPEAEDEVARRFGNYEAYRKLAMRIDEETMRQRTFSETIETLRREVRLAARVLVRTPAFSLIAFVTLALGIGATTAIFTVLDAVVLRPLPYPAASELVSVLHPVTVPGNEGTKMGPFSRRLLLFLSKEQQELRQSCEYIERGRRRSSMGFGEGGAGWCRDAVNLHDFRARPHLGGSSMSKTPRPDSVRLAVLSSIVWTRRFGGDRSIVGKSIHTRDGPITRSSGSRSRV